MPTTSARLKDPFVLAVLFSLLLLVYEEWYFTGQYIQFLRASAAQPSAARLGSQLLLMVLLGAQVFFSWAVFTARPWWKVPYTLIFAYSALAQAGYWNALHRFLTVQDMATAYYSSAGLWRDAIGMFFSWYAFIPLALFLVFCWLTRHGQRGGRAMVGNTAVLLLFFTALYGLGYRQIPASANLRFWHTLTRVAWDGLSTPLQFERETIDYHAPTPPTNNIILVIDESVRGDHLSLNGYERPTTPYLQDLANQGLLYNWGIAAASATCSVQSNHVLFNGLATLPDPEYRVYQNPTLYQYAQAMGYDTYHIDAQADYLWNGISFSDLAYINERITPSTLGDDVAIDLLAADYIHNIISQSTGNFIIINKKGVHFPYFRAYPTTAAIWTPTVENLDYNNYQNLSNTYDNGLVYATDGFFQHLIPDPTQLNATILYTSDHGQTLSEHGEHWGHCRDTHNEAMVPLFLISPQSLALDTTYRASHFNIFATLLDLMAVPADVRSHAYPISLLHATAADSLPRHYLPADRDFFTGEVVSFDPISN